MGTVRKLQSVVAIYEKSASYIQLCIVYWLLKQPHCMPKLGSIVMEIGIKGLSNGFIVPRTETEAVGSVV